MTENRPLVDSYGRRIENLRISITDRCNFRCQYCMPAEGLPWLDREEVLTFEEIERLARIFVGLGIKDIRLTGGEPLVRKSVPDLVRRLAQIDGLESLSLTTNGVLLPRLAGDLAAAGLRRINVSLDSLDRERFAQITRRDALSAVMAGLEELEKHPSISPIKVNAVAIKGFTEPEIPAFGHFARRKPYVIRFIEFMPLDADQHWTADDILSGAEIRAILEREIMPLERLPAKASSTSQRYRFADGIGEVGFINPVSEPFCSTCDRIRMTADGQLRTCLFAIEETDLKTPLRRGAGDEALAEIIRRAVWNKELKHYIGDQTFKRASRSMSQIGG